MDPEENKQEEEEDDEPSSPAWMTTYGDMMTLLMTFFILIMSFSTMEVEKFKMAMGSVKVAIRSTGARKVTRGKPATRAASGSPSALCCRSRRICSWSPTAPLSPRAERPRCRERSRRQLGEISSPAKKS